jgi:TRAP-type C4-dicarboxylate transport system permease small subunit
MRSALKVIARGVDLGVILIGATLLAIVLANVVLHLVGRDLAWVTELGEFLMVWVTFLGGVAAAQRNSHMAITELLDKLSPARRRWADAAVQLVVVAMLLMLLVYGVSIVNNSWGSVLTTLEWPMAWQYMPMPIAALLMLVFHTVDLVDVLRGRAIPTQAAVV